MNRREVVQLGAAALAAGAGLLPAHAFGQQVCAPCEKGVAGPGAARLIELEIGDLESRMVDGTRLNMLAFRRVAADSAWRVPGPVIRVKEGTSVSMRITNTRKETHGFEITGVPASKTEIAPGCTCTVHFTAPEAGTYIYHDALGGSPLYRILGLHGVLVVEPAFGYTDVTPVNTIASLTPYSLDKLAPLQRQAISALFDALGTTDLYQGGAEGKWVACGEDFDFSIQEKVWVIGEVDPKFNALVERGRAILSNPSITSDVIANYVPRYFTINNRSGYDLHIGEDVCPENYVGEPTILRIVNSGLAHHSMHVHGNHVLRLSQSDLDPASPTYGKVQVADNIFEVDIWSMWPMDRRDVLIPFEIPSDIPYKTPVNAAVPGPTQFQRMLDGRTNEPFPLRYVFHDHTEMGTTAAGGNYPQGMVTHFEIVGGLFGRKAAANLAAKR
jgi:hypothetical protein